MRKKKVKEAGAYQAKERGWHTYTIKTHTQTHTHTQYTYTKGRKQSEQVLVDSDSIFFIQLDSLFYKTHLIV